MRGSTRWGRSSADERRGLVVPPSRRHSGQRQYDEADIGRVKVIKAAQRLGFTLHRRTTGELRARATAKIAEIDGRIVRLRAMRVELTAVVASDCDSLTDCSCGLGRPLPFVEVNAVAD